MAFSVSLEANLNLAITYTIAVKWKEKYDAVVVECHHRRRFCGDRMKMSLPIRKKKKIFFFSMTPTSPCVLFRAKCQPLAYFLQITYLLISYKNLSALAI